MEEQEKETIKVSKQTADLLRLKKDFYKLNFRLIDIIEDIYGVQQGEDIYNHDYGTPIQVINAKLDAHIMDKINDQLGIINEELSI